MSEQSVRGIVRARIRVVRARARTPARFSKHRLVPAPQPLPEWRNHKKDDQRRIGKKHRKRSRKGRRFGGTHPRAARSPMQQVQHISARRRITLATLASLEVDLKTGYDLARSRGATLRQIGIGSTASGDRASTPVPALSTSGRHWPLLTCRRIAAWFHNSGTTPRDGSACSGDERVYEVA